MGRQIPFLCCSVIAEKALPRLCKHYLVMAFIEEIFGNTSRLRTINPRSLKIKLNEQRVVLSSPQAENPGA
jgi:hypothetical protein